MLERVGKELNISHKWHPIELIDDGSGSHDFSEIDNLQRQWLEIKKDVVSSTPEAYRTFTERLTRRWAIETGIIEGIYDLDTGVTETLVREGIATDHIERNSTNKEPSELVEILRDHQASIASVNAWIEESRPLTKWFIGALHSQILKNQYTTRAVDQFGVRFDAELVKGEFKTLPNNPTRSDESVHEYCPPEQVGSEIENLLAFYEEYEEENCHPLLLAAWLHHRFEQIHPFQDGNGRVGRAILTWHLVRKGFFPIVISRGDRAEYLNSLEKADRGSLKDLIELFVSIEKNTILQALNTEETETLIVPEPQAQVDLVDQVIDSIVNRLERRRKSEVERMRSVNDVAIELRAKVTEYLDEKSQDIKKGLSRSDIHVEHRIDEGGPDRYNTEHWYWTQVKETAHASGHWVNRNEPRYFVKLSINPLSRDLMPRLIFVISLHNAGRQLTGIMASTSFAEIEYYDEEDTFTQSSRQLDNSDFKNCTVNPFTFTWEDSIAEVGDRFVKWTEVCFSIALRHWMDNS